MAYVQGSLGEKISKTMDDAAALFKQGDYQQSIDMFARAWDLLPDSKYSYDAVSYTHLTLPPNRLV